MTAYLREIRSDAAVKAVTPDESKQKDWMKTIKNRLNAGRVDDVIADLLTSTV